MVLKPIKINDFISIVFPEKIIPKNSKKSSNFKIRTNNDRLIKKIKSIALSRIIVPKSLSIGIFSV